MSIFGKLLGKTTQTQKAADNSVDIAALTAAADSGDAEAQHKLANCYYKGIGVIQNKDRAHELFLLSANNGHLPAQYQMYAHCLLYGQLEDCFYWAEKAANGGKPQFINMLGLAYQNGGEFVGLPVDKDLDLAEKCFRVGADKDHADSQYGLALTLAEKTLDHPTPKDYIEFLTYMYQAAQNGHEEAIKYIKENKKEIDELLQQFNLDLVLKDKNQN